MFIFQFSYTCYFMWCFFLAVFLQCIHLQSQFQPQQIYSKRKWEFLRWTEGKRYVLEVTIRGLRCHSRGWAGQTHQRLFFPLFLLSFLQTHSTYQRTVRSTRWPFTAQCPSPATDPTTVTSVESLWLWASTTQVRPAGKQEIVSYLSVMKLTV